MPEQTPEEQLAALKDQLKQATERLDEAAESNAQLVRALRLATERQSTRQEADDDEGKRGAAGPDDDEVVKFVFDGMDMENPDGRLVVKRLGQFVRDQVTKATQSVTEMTAKKEAEYASKQREEQLLAQGKELAAELKAQGIEIKNYAKPLLNTLQQNPTLTVKQAFTLIKDDVNKELGITTEKKPSEGTSAEDKQDALLRTVLFGKPQEESARTPDVPDTFSLNDMGSLSDLYEETMKGNASDER